MPATKEELISTAVRPLADDAEAQMAARQMLADSYQENTTAAGKALQRWSELDAKPRKPLVQIGLLLVLILSGIGILGLSVKEGIRIRIAIKQMASAGLPHAANVGKKDLTPAQQLVLYGDSSKLSRSDRWKALWDQNPGNAAYFAQYAFVHLSDHETLPLDFLDTARRIDPQNAWFTYVAAAVAAEGATGKKAKPPGANSRTPSQWEVLDPARLNEALALLREARSQPLCKDYQKDLMAEKIALMDQSTILKRFHTLAHLAGLTAADTVAVRRLGDVFAAQALLLAQEKREEDYRELVADFEDMSRKTLRMDVCSMVPPLVFRVIAQQSTSALASAAKDLGHAEESTRFQKAYDGIQGSRDMIKNRQFTVDGVDFRRKSDLISGLMTPMVALRTRETVEISDEELKPVRTLEHDYMAILCSAVLFPILGILAFLTWIYRFRHRKLHGHLALRMKALLLPGDWCGILLPGVVLPSVFILTLTFLTPLSGRDFSIYGHHLAMPASHFLDLLLLVTIVPILLIRRALARRAASFGFSSRRAWIGWGMVGIVILHAIITGILAKNGMTNHIVKAESLLALPVLWLLCTAIRALLTGHVRSLATATTARTLPVVYATAMLCAVWIIPIFKASADHWFSKDTLLRLDPAAPGWGGYESKVTTRYQQETRELLGIEK